MYNVCLLHDFVATLLSALPSALYWFVHCDHVTSIAAHLAFRKAKCFVLCFTFPFLLCIILVIKQEQRLRLGSRKTGLRPPVF